MVTEEVTEEEKVIKRQYSQSMEIESGLETPLLRTSISVKAPTQFVNTAEQRHKWKSVATRERKLKGRESNASIWKFAHCWNRDRRVNRVQLVDSSKMTSSLKKQFCQR